MERLSQLLPSYIASTHAFALQRRNIFVCTLGSQDTVVAAVALARTTLWNLTVQVADISRLALQQLLGDNTKQRPALLFGMLEAAPPESKPRMAQVRLSSDR